MKRLLFSNPTRRWQQRGNGRSCSSASTSSELQMTNRDGDDDESVGEAKKTEKNSSSADSPSDQESEVSADEAASMQQSVVAFVEQMKQKWEDLLSKNPALAAALETVGEKLHQTKLVFLGIVAGAVLAFAAILVPIYSQVETLSQPVTLFETILGDLESAYVDPIDTQKLFETGISAMLRSLDPYTEFESREQAGDLTESIEGKYAGVGLVIAGSTTKEQTPIVGGPAEASESKLLPKEAIQDQKPEMLDGDLSTTSNGKGAVGESAAVVSDDAEEEDELDVYARKQVELARAQGIRVVSAFEGYAFDYGLRIGDKLLAIDDKPIDSTTTVSEVRNALRGEPGTVVTIDFERDGVKGVQRVSMPRAVVRIRDVKLATLLGKPSDGIGYIQLSGFASETGREMRNAIHYLQQATEDATNGERSLQGLILDLRGNPGGLLTSAVDVASLLVPKGSDIVSAKGRGFPGVLYRSRMDPILSPDTKLAVLVNGGTASAAEIVSGAVQDLDVGVIVGSDRTFGKGLVQNVEDLPFETALKFTVAKYYTPSGRCIQGINYAEGGGLGEADGKYVAKKVAEKDRNVFYTKSGRVVRDGGGIEADFKVEAPKASALEVTLLRSGVFRDFAAEWCKKNELTHNFDVDEDTYKGFQAYVNEKQRSGELKLEQLYGQPLNDLKKALKKSGYKGSEKVVEQLQASIVREVQKDFEKYRSDIKEDISQNILARYLPESMLIQRGVQSDKQILAAMKLLTNQNKFDTLLAKGSSSDRSNDIIRGGMHGMDNDNNVNVASSSRGDEDADSKIRAASLSW